MVRTGTPGSIGDSPADFTVLVSTLICQAIVIDRVMGDEEKIVPFRRPITSLS